MNTLTGCLRCVLPAVFFLAAVADASSDNLQRKTLTKGDYTFEYSAGDEILAQGFADRIGELFETDASAETTANFEPTPVSPTEQTDEYLAAVCHYLSLSEPTPKMVDAFNKFGSVINNLDAAIGLSRTTLKHFQLWRGSELKACLEAGQTIPNISMRADGGGAVFDLPEMTEPMDFRNWAMPLMIRSRDLESGTPLVTVLIDQGREVLTSLASGPIRHIAVFLALHETVEISIIENFLISRDRRWFCDGVANYVPFKILEDELGAEAARQYYDIDSQLAMYADLRPTIDLKNWAVAEDQEQHDRHDRYNKAKYAFATEVMFKVEANHGPEFLPTLLANVEQGQLDKTTMETVYQAYEELYDEDLRSYLPVQ